MRRNRESPEPKRKRCDVESTAQYSSSSESEDEKVEEVKTSLVKFHNVTEEVVLTAEEEEEFLELSAQYEHDYDVELELLDDTGEFDYHSSDSGGSCGGSRTPSPGHTSSSSDDEAQDRLEQRQRVITRSYQVSLGITSHEKLQKFLLRTTQDGKLEMFPTSKWNHFPKEVYKHFNVSMRIVHPNYFLATENDPSIKVSSLLTELEFSNKLLSWSYVKQHLAHFLHGFKGFERLADVFNEKELAAPLIRKFYNHIERAYESEENPDAVGWYRVFRTLVRVLVNQQKNHRESTFYQYIEALLNQLNIITHGMFSRRTCNISLTLPASKYTTEKVLWVQPDFMMLGNPSALMIVGEVKRFGCRGIRYIKHKGHRVKEVQPAISDSGLVPQTKLESDQPQGEEDQLPPAVTEKRKSFPSVTTNEPQVSTHIDQPRGQGDQLPPTVTKMGKSFLSVTTDEPHVSTDTDQLRGQGDQLSPTVTEKGKPFLSTVTIENKPHASTSQEQAGYSTKGDKSTVPVRTLDSKERYKVDAYLPQLFGQMLAAMEFNDNRKMGNWSYKFCQDFENVQFGFAVEGFKLRFVKLTLVDLQKKQNPTVRALLSGQRFKCHISMTQEFNLLKKRHLKLFYKMLMAISYVSN